MSRFNVSLTAWAESQDSVYEPQFLKRRERRAEADRTEVLLTSRNRVTVATINLLPESFGSTHTYYGTPHVRPPYKKKKKRNIFLNGHVVFKERCSSIGGFFYVEV